MGRTGQLMGPEVAPKLSSASRRAFWGSGTAYAFQSCCTVAITRARTAPWTRLSKHERHSGPGCRSRRGQQQPGPHILCITVRQHRPARLSCGAGTACPHRARSLCALCCSV